MKRLLIFAFLICGIMQAWAAKKWTDDNGHIWDFEVINGNEAKVTHAQDYASTVEIPMYVYDGETPYLVTEIGSNSGAYPLFSYSWGGNNETVEEVVLPSTVTAVNGHTFYYAHKLKKINLDNVTYLGGRSFMQCNNLIDVGSLSNVTELCGEAFRECSNLAVSITIPEGATSIGDYAFYNCSSLTSVTIPSSVTSIGNYAFSNCSGLTSVTISEGVTSIGSSAFSNCTGLTSVTIPEGVTSIGNNVFYYCTGLTSVTIPSSVTSIGSSAFYNCPSLTSVTIPEGVTSIGERVFSECSGLTSVTIPSSVTSIGYEAFYSCSGLTSVTIPSSVTSIGNRAFLNCSGLTSVTIPSSVTSIGQEAFQNCSRLSSVTIPSTTVPSLANTNALPMVVLVPESAFEDYLAADVWKDMADRITIFDLDYNDYSASVSARETASGLHANIGEGNLRKVVNLKVSGTINSYDVMVIRNKMLCLRNLDLSDATIVANNYEYYSGCKSEDNKIGDNMFRDLKILSFKAPRTVTTMGSEAFVGCSGLKDVTLYEGLKNIGNNAFNGCGIERLTVPAGVVTIGQGAFAHCTNLQEISLPDGLEDIGSYAFLNCRIREITIPEGVKRLRYCTFCGSYEYYGSDYLTKVNLPSTLEVIEWSPFGGCDGWRPTQLTELILPVGLKRIEGSLGYNGKITEIRIPPMMEYIAAGALQNYSAIKDYYVYVVDPINIDMSSFANYTTATLHVPTQSYNAYYWNTQWSQFANLVEFNEPYSRFYLQNDYTLEDDKRFDGEPDADFQANSGFIVDGEDNQDMGDIHVIGNGTDAATIIDDGNITAQNVYFDITVNANRWYFFAFPFRVKVSDIVAPGYFALRWYDGEARAQYGQGGWKDFTGEYLEPGIGYIFQCNTNGTLHLPTTNPQFDGQDKDSQLEVHHSDNNQHASWNFMGNPWLSYFDINDCGFDAPFTIWNGSGYDAYRPGDDDYMLHPFQAFFVQTPGGNNGMHFGHGDRYTYHQGQNHQTAAHAKRMAKGINPKRLRLDMTISNGTDSDRTRVVFNADKQNVYELGTDAAKFMTADMPQLYTLDGTNTRYAINERPYGEVKLGFNAPKAGAYTIAIQRMDEPMLLRDLLTGTTVKISEKDYTFDSGAGTFDSRFILVPDNGTTGIAQLYEKTGVSVIGADHGLYINGADRAEVNVYSTTGAAVAQRASNGFLPMQRGTYLVTVNGTTTKVMVR